MFFANFSTELTTNSRRYRRPDGESPNYFYLLRQFTVESSANYLIRIISRFVTYCYLYADNFDSLNPRVNLVGQGQSDSSGQLQLSIFLEGPTVRSKRVCILIYLSEVDIYSMGLDEKSR